MYRFAHDRLARRDPALALRLSHWAAHALRAAPAPAPAPAARVFGIDFPAPLGLAAGVDRHGALTALLARAGLGFTEIGTLNVSGPGAVPAALAPVLRNLARAEAARAQLRIGASIGTRAPDPDAATEACVAAVTALAARIDFAVLNLSRPGSVTRDGGCDPRRLQRLTAGIVHQVRAQGTSIPLLVKLACPPGDGARWRPALDAVLAGGAAGCVCAFEGWTDPGARLGQVEQIARAAAPAPIVAVGGIGDAADARAALGAGARLVQIYGAFVQRGPWHVRRLAAALRHSPHRS